MKLLSEIARDCLELPSAQRLKLARILIDVSEPGQDCAADIQASWDGEIGARIDALKNGTAKTLPIAEVFAQLDQLYPA